MGSVSKCSVDVNVDVHAYVCEFGGHFLTLDCSEQIVILYGHWNIITMMEQIYFSKSRPNIFLGGRSRYFFFAKKIFFI